MVLMKAFIDQIYMEFVYIDYKRYPEHVVINEK